MFNLFIEQFGEIQFSMYQISIIKKNDDAFKNHKILSKFLRITIIEAMNSSVEISTNKIALNLNILTLHNEWIYIVIYKKRGVWICEDVYLGMYHFKRIYGQIQVPPPIIRNHEQLVFDCKKELIINYDHILIDNCNRLPESLKPLHYVAQRATLTQLVELVKIEAITNCRLIIPQMFNDRIGFLMHIKFGDEYMILAIDTTEKHYTITTTLSAEMAYAAARVVSNVEDTWLAECLKLEHLRQLKSFQKNDNITQ